MALISTWLPEAPGRSLRDRILARFPGAIEERPQGRMAQVSDAIVRLLDGKPVDFAFAPLDMAALPEFDRKVLEAARAIPAGTTITYGALAARIGAPGAARGVGAALGRNPFPIVIPCHRILSANGSGGFSAPGGISTKLRLLGIEKAGRGGEPELFAALPLAVAPARRA